MASLFLEKHESSGEKRLVEELGQTLFAVIGGEPSGFAAIKAKLLNRKKPGAKKYRIFLEEDGLDSKEIEVALEKQIVAIRCSRQLAQTLWPPLADKCRKKLQVVRDGVSMKSPHIAQGSLVAMKANTAWCIGGFLDQRECQSAGREIVSEAKRRVEAGNRDFYVSRPSAVFDDLEKQQRLEHLFPSVQDRSKLKIDEEAAYSVSNESSAATVAQIAKKIVERRSRRKIGSNNDVVVDATACVGGNTLAFARVFDKVIAIEIDTKKVEFLKENIKHVRNEERHKSLVSTKVSADIRVVHGDCLCMLPRILAEIESQRVVVFADPPWGGRHYQVQPCNYGKTSSGSSWTASKESTADVHLKGSGSLMELVHACGQHACVSALLLKLPSSFDHKAFVRELPFIKHHDVHDWDLVTLLVLHFPQQQERTQSSTPIKVQKQHLKEGSVVDEKKVPSPALSGKKKRRSNGAFREEVRSASEAPQKEAICDNRSELGPPYSRKTKRGQLKAASAVGTEEAPLPLVSAMKKRKKKRSRCHKLPSAIEASPKEASSGSKPVDATCSAKVKTRNLTEEGSTAEIKDAFCLTSHRQKKRRTHL